MKLEDKISDHRPLPPPELVERYRTAYFEYYNKLYTACSKRNPMQKEYYENAMKNRAKDFEMDIKRYS